MGPIDDVRIHSGFHRGVRVDLISLFDRVCLGFHIGVKVGPVSLVSEHGYRFCRLLHDACTFPILLSDIMTFLFISACVDVADLARDL